MIETEELRQKLVILSGTELRFNFGTVYGFPGFSMEYLDRGESSVSAMENPQYSFTVTTKDTDIYEILVDSEFILSDSVYEYNFKVINNPINYLDGWSKFKADITDKSLL